MGAEGGNRDENLELRRLVRQVIDVTTHETKAPGEFVCRCGALSPPAILEHRFNFRTILEDRFVDNVICPKSNL